LWTIIVLVVSGVIRFLREVIMELRRVTWPSWSELIRYTLVVLFTVALLGGFIFLVDLAVVGLLQRFVYNVH
jgi:preprotein translocase subunit SecE